MEETKLKKQDNMDSKRFAKFMKFAQRIILPVSLEELKKPLKPQEVKRLNEICDNELGPSQPARSTSAIYLDRNHVPVLFYFGKRIVHPKGQPPVSKRLCFLYGSLKNPQQPIDAKDQFRELTDQQRTAILISGGKLIHDGIHVSAAIFVGW